MNIRECKKQVEIADGDSHSILNGDLTLTPNTIWLFTIMGVGSSIDKTETVNFEYKGQIKNIGGTTELIDTPLKVMEFKEGNVTLEISADDEDDSLKILFTNSSGQTYKVSTYVKLMRVG